MLVPSGSPFETMLPEIKIQIGISCTFPDLNRLALTSKMGSIWANALFELFANEIKCEGQTPQERKSDLAKLYREISPNFIRSLYLDIDEIKDRVFENWELKIEYGEGNYTSFFLIKFACETLRMEPFNSKEIVKGFETTVTDDMFKLYKRHKLKPSGVILLRDIGLVIKKTLTNQLSNVVSTQLLEGLKKASALYFKKLCSALVIPDLTLKNKWPFEKRLEKYTNKYALVIYEKNRVDLNLGCCYSLIERLLIENNFLGKVDLIVSNVLTGVYGEKKDIQKFHTILKSQRFPEATPSLATLKEARGLLS